MALFGDLEIIYKGQVLQVPHCKSEWDHSCPKLFNFLRSFIFIINFFCQQRSLFSSVL